MKRTAALTIGLALLAAQAMGAAAAGPTPDDERQARAAAVRQTLDAINRALADNGGTFEKWAERLKPFRDDVRQTIAKARPIKGGRRISGAELQMLLVNSLQEMPEDKTVFEAVLHLDRQLKGRGIDLVFLPIPDKSAVYPEVLSDHVPADGLVALPVLHLMKRLLEQDVECINMYPVYRDFRRETRDKAPLYYEHQDIHWRNQAAQLAAEEIARRLRRYAFVQKALAAGNPYRSEPFKRGGGKADLVRAVFDTRTTSAYADVPDSPVVLTSDSYGMYCFGLKDEAGRTWDGHLSGQVALNIGLPLTHLHQQGLWGHMPVVLAQEERDNGYLKGRRVIVFTCIARSFDHTKWQVADLPPPPGAAATSARAAMPAEGLVARGTVSEVSGRPSTKADYPDFIMSLYLTGLADERGRPIGRGDAVARVLAMKDRRLLAAAGLQVGQQVAVRLLAWDSVKTRYERTMTGTLPTTALNLQKELYWAELAP
jgi:hypothetical protein